MKKRYLTPCDSVIARISAETSPMRFTGTSPKEFLQWKTDFKSRLDQFLGPWPEKVPLDPEILEKKDCGDYIREKIVFDSDPWNSVPAYVLIPKSPAPKGGKYPAVLACHGHGRGKIDVCGVVKNKKEYKQNIIPLNYDYGVQFVKRGYVVIAPDWRGFGERSSNPKWVRPGRDHCNVEHMAYGYFGYQLLRLDIWDGMRCIDYLQTRPEVNPEKIGCAGLSFGGTMTTYMSLFEDRIKVVCISGYLSTLRDAFSMRGLGNFCGSQYMHGLLTIGDIPDVVSCIAPKPLIIESGRKDTCFVLEDTLKAYEIVKNAYNIAGAGSEIQQDVFNGAHAWSGAKAFPFFKKFLQD